MKFSIIIPTFNSRRLKLAVDSLLSQTIQDWELLIVDDASTSIDLSFSSDLCDSRIRLIKHGVNRGGGAARNTGMNLAVGEYIAFLDHDDEWDPRKLELQLKEMENAGTREKLFCYTRVSEISDAYKETRPQRGIKGDETVSDYALLNDGLILGSSVVISRDLAMLVKFDERSPVDDLTFAMKCQMHGAVFVYCPFTLVNWYREDNKNGYSRTAHRALLYEWLQEFKGEIRSEAKAFVIVFWIWPQLFDDYGYLKALLLMSRDLLLLPRSIAKIVPVKQVIYRIAISKNPVKKLVKMIIR